MDQIYNLIIIGSGPAGLSAAIYAARAGLEALVIEENFESGGQILSTTQIDNYPGLPKISGPDLAQALRSHAESLGAVFVCDTVQEVCLKDTLKTVRTEKKTYTCEGVILACGAEHKPLGVPGEEELAGAGVSYCATCDGAFFKNRVCAVVGGGDTAVEDALFLSRICKTVYLIHRRKELRAARSLSRRLFELPNVRFLPERKVIEIVGEDQVEALRLINGTGAEEILAVDGVFAAVGIVPRTSLFSEELLLSENGYVLAGEDCRTSLPFVYAAGDLRKKPLRQILTAAADGANAVTSYLEDNKED